MAQEQQQQQEQQQGITCTGDCLQCSPNQRAYCSAQFTYRTMRLVESLQVVVGGMQSEMAELRAKIDTMQRNEEDVFDPTAKPQKHDELFQEEAQ